MIHDTWNLTPDTWHLKHIFFLFLPLPVCFGIGATIPTRQEFQCFPYAGLPKIVLCISSIFPMSPAYSRPFYTLMCADSSINIKTKQSSWQKFMSWQTILNAWSRKMVVTLVQVFNPKAVLHGIFVTICVISYCLDLRHPPREGGTNILTEKHRHAHCDL